MSERARKLRPPPAPGPLRRAGPRAAAARPAARRGVGDAPAASFARLPLAAARVGGGGRAPDAADLPRLAVPMAAQAEPEFDQHPPGLKQFAAFTGEVSFARINAAQCAFEAPFSVYAEFAPPCGEFEYRQFIAGHIVRDPDGAAEDRGDLLNRLPLGRLWPSFQEDGDMSATPPKYGYRGGPASSNPKVIDQYSDAKGAVDQAQGCRYEATDTPYAVFNAASGEVWDIELRFYGEIRRNGRAIQRRHWTAIRGRYTAP